MLDGVWTCASVTEVRSPNGRAVVVLERDDGSRLEISGPAAVAYQLDHRYRFQDPMVCGIGYGTDPTWPTENPRAAE